MISDRPKLDSPLRHLFDSGRKCTQYAQGLPGANLQPIVEREQK